MRKFYSFCLFLTSLSFTQTAHAQLDSIHWIPPMHGRSELGPQYLYISTPETTPFDVTIRDGAGTWLGTVTISNAQPARWMAGSSGAGEIRYSLLLQQLLYQCLLILYVVCFV